MERWASPYLEAQAAYLRALGRSAAAEVLERDQVYAVRTGVASNTENGIISPGDHPIGPELAGELVAWMGADAVPASWLVAEGAGRPETAGVLEQLGCEPELEAWEMEAAIAELELTDIPAPAGVSIGAVEDARQLEAWLDVAGVCGWFDNAAERTAWQALLSGLPLSASAPLVLYLANAGEQPVGMASAFYTPELCLLNAVAVVPEARRNGIGRALAHTRLEEARRRGLSIAVLAPSPDGERLYQTLGFRRHLQPPARWFYLPA